MVHTAIDAVFKSGSGGMLVEPEYEGGVHVIRTGQRVMVRALFRITDGSAKMDALARDYARFKRGSVEESRRYAAALSAYIHREIKGAIDISHDVIAVVNWRLPTVSSLLAQQVAQRLGGLSICYLGAQKPSAGGTTHYEEISSLQDRQQNANTIAVTSVADYVLIQGKRIFLIDDATVSGTAIDRAVETLLRAGADQVVPFVVAHLQGYGDHSFEWRVNETGFSENDLWALMALLNDPHTIYNFQLVDRTLRLSDAAFENVIESLDLNALWNLYLAGIVFYRWEPTVKMDRLATLLLELTGLSFPGRDWLRQYSWKAIPTIVGMLDAHKNRILADATRRTLASLSAA